MATTTTNYGLSKPALSDYYDITVFNGDMDTIDTALYSIATDVAELDSTATSQASTISELQEDIEANATAITALQSADKDLQTQITQNASDISSIDASEVAASSYDITTENDEQTYSFDTVEDFMIYTLEALQLLGLSVDDEGYVTQETGD